MLFKSARIMVRLFYALLITCATLVTLLILLLSLINLDDYRQSLEAQLSSTLNQPVSIAHGSLTYSNGLALELEQIQIGADEQPIITIPRLLATLEITPLLEKRFILNQVSIEKPLVNLTFPLKAQTERPTKESSRKLFNSLGISILTVNDAEVTIYQAQEKSLLKRLKIANLHAVLKGWKQNQKGQLVISGDLPQQKANFLLETKLSASIDPHVLRQEQQSLKLNLHNLSTASIPKLKGQSYPEALNLEINIQGAPSTGTQFKTTLQASKTAEQLFSLNGTWTSTEDQDSISNLKGELLGVPLTGEFVSLRQADRNYLVGRLGVTNLGLNQQLLKKWRIPQADQLIRGDVELLFIELSKDWPVGTELKGLPQIDAQLTLSSLEWNIPELKQLQDLSIDLSLKNNYLDIRDGILIIGGEPVDFSGTIESPFLKPELSLLIEAKPRLETISTLRPLKNWDIAGEVPLSLQLRGPLQGPSFGLQADFNQVEVQHPWLFQKKQSTNAQLSAAGALSAGGVTLNRVDVLLGKISLSASGYIDHSSDQTSYGLSIAPLQLAQLKPFSPLLKRLQITGETALTLQKQKNGLQGTINIQDGGAHLTPVIADLRNTTGSARLDHSGLSFTDLKASLGESEFLVNGLLSDWSSPRLSLDIQADKARAQDLVFSNQELMLYDLNGRLQIDGNGIDFAPVNVRLEKDTIAQVTGSVANFSDPQVKLDIKADSVNVLDVINLFNGPDRAPSAKTKSNRQLKPIEIRATAQKGTLGGLNFTNAVGFIKEFNHQFSIFPLRFENGEGWCKARVDFLHKEKSRPLKISGHVEEINASVLHQDLFDQPGLINGKLSGDFYLEGKPDGKTFWQTARGGIHLQVADGTLRKFHSLAKVFQF